MKGAVLAALCVAALGTIQATAQTATSMSPNKAMRIEYSSGLGTMSATIRAALVNGLRTTPLVFEETKSTCPVWHTYTTKPITASSTAQITGDISGVLHLVAFPNAPGRKTAWWKCNLNLVDASSGAVLLKGLSHVWCITPRVIDTMMANAFRVDLAKFSGRKVYLQLIASPEPDMLPSRRISTVDADIRQTNDIR
ncbi:MAG: hypothetical protein JST22_16035 [Bacteroidetes bacterium]|nr:hypothetical protein [Bacteroidota bacterium]